MVDKSGANMSRRVEVKVRAGVCPSKRVRVEIGHGLGMAETAGAQENVVRLERLSRFIPAR